MASEVAKKWLEIVDLISPSGTTTSASIMVNGHQKASDIYVVRSAKSFTYVVPLSRDLLEDEAGKIAIAWSRTCIDGDFEITFSQRQSSMERKAESVSMVLDEIAENVAKMLHTEWVNEKVSYHWNYGTRYNPASKTHPLLLPWEQLPRKAKDSEISRARKTLEILDSINLKITRK